MNNDHEKTEDAAKPSIEKGFLKAMEEALETHKDLFKRLKESETYDKVKKMFPGN